MISQYLKKEEGLVMLIGELANNLVRLTEQQDDEWVYCYDWVQYT